MVTGAVALAEFAHVVAAKYPSTSPSTPTTAPRTSWTPTSVPCLEVSAERVKAGQNPLFQSHMWDGSAVPLEENLPSPRNCWPRRPANKQILEIEVGVVGGEEDGVANEINEKLYSTIEDGLATAAALGLGEKGRYITALTFGNVHGVYKPGARQAAPRVLKEIQDAVAAKYGKERPSTWSSTAARAPPRRRSPRPSPTASSR
jgi:fructose-bisphosphate aldolase class II